MFNQYCAHCLTEGMCFEEGTCVKEVVDKALGYNDDMLKAPEADLTDNAKIDHLLIMERIERSDAEHNED